MNSSTASIIICTILTMMMASTHHVKEGYDGPCPAFPSPDCKSCMSEFTCKTGKQGAYKDASTCGCDGPKDSEDVSLQKSSGFKCTIPPSSPSSSPVKACNDISMIDDTCRHNKTSSSCTGVGASGSKCAWYDPSDGSYAEGGVCYDTGSSGFFAHCDNNGNMCIPGEDGPGGTVGSAQCGNVWIPTPGNETCSCDTNVVKWSIESELPNSITPEQKDTLYNEILTQMNEQADSEDGIVLSNLTTLGNKQKAYPPNNCKIRDVPFVSSDPTGPDVNPHSSKVSGATIPSPVVYPIIPLNPISTGTSTETSIGTSTETSIGTSIGTSSSEGQPVVDSGLDNVFPLSWGSPPGKAYKTRQACLNVSNGDACKNISGQGSLNYPNLFVNTQTYNWYKQKSHTKVSEPPVDCIQTDWVDSGTCSKDCGGGTQLQTREITQHPNSSGIACGPATREIGCNKHVCEVVDCKLKQHLTECVPHDKKRNCGSGQQTKTFTISQYPRGGGAECNVPDPQIISCEGPPCPKLVDNPVPEWVDKGPMYCNTNSLRGCEELCEGWGCNWQKDAGNDKCQGATWTQQWLASGSDYTKDRGEQAYNRAPSWCGRQPSDPPIDYSRNVEFISDKL